ncbi:hypothetical protein M145_4136 [Bacteroides fragilis str. 34-F-2 |nr:hypothetical protein M078_3973 [Bacteroides fragilis str. 2-F-2 \
MHSSYFYLNEAVRFNPVIYNITVYFGIIGYGCNGFIAYYQNPFSLTCKVSKIVALI